MHSFLSVHFIAFTLRCNDSNAIRVKLRRNEKRTINDPFALKGFERLKEFFSVFLSASTASIAHSQISAAADRPNEQMIAI